MRFTKAAVLSLAAAALAAPQLAPADSPTENIVNDITIAQAEDTCGSDMELSCCNNDAANTADGLLNEPPEEAEENGEPGDPVGTAISFLDDLLEDFLENAELSVFFGCSKLNVASLFGVDDLLNSQCTQTAACCQNSYLEQNGLVNIGLPCIALGGFL